MAEQAVEKSMEKLANELIERLGAVEAEKAALQKDNDVLRAQVAQMAKSASETQVKQVSEDLLDTTCKSLVKCGALRTEQVDQAKEYLRKDPDASLKVIQHILDEKALAKSAAADESLRGGRIVGVVSVKRSPEDECLERMCKILQLY